MALPLAMTQVGAVLLAVSLVASVALFLYAIWPQTWSPRLNPKRRLTWLLLVPLEFAALWLWLNPAITLLVWLFVFGDNLNEFRMNAFVLAPATLLAVVTSASLTVRIARGTASPRYLRIHLWATLLLLTMYGGMRGYDYASRIEGTTARRAAENFLARYEKHLDGARLVERSSRSGPEDDASTYKRYWIMVANEPKVRFTVYRMGWFAWTVGSNRPVEPSRPQLDRAKRAIRERDPETAELVLKRVIEDYPDTDDGSEARELLLSLSPTGKPEVRGSRSVRQSPGLKKVG